MPPKDLKKAISMKKAMSTFARPLISGCSLLRVPSDAVEGYQQRIEEGIEWTALEAGARHHKQQCLREDVPTLRFTEALENKIRNSYLDGFLDENSNFTLKEQWEIFLPMKLWDNEKCATEEEKICFRSTNCITDNLLQIIDKAVRANSRQKLRKELKKVSVLRVTGCKMTDLDEGLLEYKNLISLNLCGNFICSLNSSWIPETLKSIELQFNQIHELDSFSDLAADIVYVGLSRNLLDDESVPGFCNLPPHLVVLDLSDNDIYNLQPVIDALMNIPTLVSLSLAGNPCSVCPAYARSILKALPNLEWLDNRQVLPDDRPEDELTPHADDFRATYFEFSVIRIISVPPPPKLTEKGAEATFQIEVELPLLDATRRQFLMFHKNESLIEILPTQEEDNVTIETSMKNDTVDLPDDDAATSEETNIYARLCPKNSRIIQHYKTITSNKVPWNKIMSFQDPIVRIFCPDLVALRNTFRSMITVRLIYCQYIPPPKAAKPDKKSTVVVPAKPAVPSEQFVTIFTVKCPLRRFDWSNPSQHFHWDESLDTDEAMHWGDGDLSVLQYHYVPPPSEKPGKGVKAVKSVKSVIKPKSDVNVLVQPVPDIMTAHFAFKIDTF